MRYLHEFADTEKGESPLSPAEFNGYLMSLARVMFDRGWTVLGSRFKTPALHKWGETTREQLFEWTMADLQSMRANSLNLRLKDTSVIALDCDVYNESVMERFVFLVHAVIGSKLSGLYTCVGGKGGKLFFRYSGPRPPAVLATAFDCGEKQMLEVKSYLSTFAGVYNADYAVYYCYPETSYVGDAAPSDLPSIGFNELRVFKRLFLECCADAGFQDSTGNILALSWFKRSVRSVLALFYKYCRENQIFERVAMPLTWCAFCGMQGSDIYRQAICFGFFQQQPEYPVPLFRLCQDDINEVMNMVNTGNDKELTFLAEQCMSVYFSSYAAVLLTRLKMSHAYKHDGVPPMIDVFVRTFAWMR